jgi:hypothetical protein
MNPLEFYLYIYSISLRERSSIHGEDVEDEQPHSVAQFKVT